MPVLAHIAMRTGQYVAQGFSPALRGDVESGYNVGASLGICVNRRMNLLLRYDRRLGLP